MSKKIKWIDAPEDCDYLAACSYLRLTHRITEVKEIIANLRRAEMDEFKVKDIFRASELPMLDKENAHVKKEADKIEEGKGIAPILLYRDTGMGRLVVLDGYHRLCAVYLLDTDALIPCKIV